MYKDITSFQEALKRYKNPFDFEAYEKSLSILPPEIARGNLALTKLQIATWAINNDDPSIPEWEPDYNNSNQNKWFNWYVGGDKTGAGFRFCASSCGWTRTDASGGARLALKDKGRANHMNKYFFDLYMELYLMLEI